MNDSIILNEKGSSEKVEEVFLISQWIQNIIDKYKEDNRDFPYIIDHKTFDLGKLRFHIEVERP